MVHNKMLHSTLLLMILSLNHLSRTLGTPSPYPHPTLAPQKPACGTYGQSPCAFVPAPPGMTPKCVSPGSTFCETNPDYPAYLIKHLVETLGYQRIIASEEMVDFGANKPLDEEEHLHHHYHHFYGSFAAMDQASKPQAPKHSSPGYSYLTPTQQSLGTVNYEAKRPAPVPQPIYIPKPQHSYHYNSYVRAPMYNRQPDRQGYFYPSPGGSASNSPSSSSPVTQYSPADWLKRFARDLSDRHRREARLAALRRADGPADPFDNEPTPFRLPSMVNETVYERLLAKNTRAKRQAADGVKETLCSVRERYITPQTALNTKGNWMFVVNQENSRQLVKTEVCASTECSNLCSFPIGYSSRCEQRYVQKRLVTLDPTGRTLYVDTYWFPSCCVCSLYSGN
ncbi:protein spaetzle 5-like [Anopheles arabiensis]|nr:protein spaetzle 5-like [Anopheles arabiensis]